LNLSFKELDKVRLLLEHISGLSDFKYKINFQKNGFDVDNNNDILVAIPNDILGTQAFYNIIENVIRNTAKHASIKPEITTFTVNFIDELNVETDKLEDAQKKLIADQQDILNNFIVVEIFDNIPIEGELLGLTKEEKEEFEKHNVDFNNERINEIVFKQNFKINADILDQNKLRSSSLGVVEMDASAAYLRKRDVGKINDSKYDIFYDESWRNADKYKYFLKAFKKVIQNENKPESKSYSLGYRFFLLRPAVVLVVTDIKPDNQEELKKEGIWIVSPKDFKIHLEGENDKPGKVYNHEFVVYATDETKIDIKTLTEEHKTSLPIRILEVKKGELENLFKPGARKEEDNKKELLDVWEEFCWKEWEIKLKKKYSYSDYCYTFYPLLNNEIARISDHLKPIGERDIQETWNYLKKDAYFVEPSSSKAQSYLPGLKNHNLEKYRNILKSNPIFKIKQSEAILANIIVVDERIQDSCEQKPMGILQQEVYEMMRVYTPKKSDVNLSSLNCKLLKNGIEKFINNTKSDVLLIHYSILERMFNSENNRLEAINNFLVNQSKLNNVVVTSGRGIPEKLPTEVRFINLSSVIMAFNDMRSKYLISYLLNSSRKSNKI
jgi:hypothetical protein